jgi:hypothetical protein
MYPGAAAPGSLPASYSKLLKVGAFSKSSGIRQGVLGLVGAMDPRSQDGRQTSVFTPETSQSLTEKTRAASNPACGSKTEFEVPGSTPDGGWPVSAPTAD